VRVDAPIPPKFTKRDEQRIQVTIPDRLAEDLEKWADYDGRPLAALKLKIINSKFKIKEVTEYSLMNMYFMYI
jgi:hypothetical protein